MNAENRDNMEDIFIESENEAYFWKVSSIVLSKIEGAGYFENKRKHNEYLSSNSFAAKELFIFMKNDTGLQQCNLTIC